MDVAAAVLLLRPEFQTRLDLNTSIVQLLRESSYFATIPHDIIGMIREFLPDLRQGQPDPEILHNYQKLIKIDPVTNCLIQLGDPENKMSCYMYGGGPADLVQGARISIKVINNQIIIIFNKTQHYEMLDDYLGQIHEYIGNAYSTTTDHYILSPHDFIMNRATCESHPINFEQYRVYYILPCGLAYVHATDEAEVFGAYLCDFVAKKQIQVKPVISFFTIGEIVDDFGECQEYPYDDGDVFLTQYSPTMLHLNLFHDIRNSLAN